MEELSEDKVKVEISEFSDEFEDFRTLHNKCCQLINEARLSTTSALGVTKQLFTDSRLLSSAQSVDTVPCKLGKALEILDACITTLIILEPTIKQITEEFVESEKNVINESGIFFDKSEKTIKEKRANKKVRSLKSKENKVARKKNVNGKIDDIAECDSYDNLNDNISECDLKDDIENQDPLASEHANLDPALAIDTKQEDSGEVLSCDRCSYVTTKKIYYQDHITGSLKYRKCPWCSVHVGMGIKMISRHLRLAHGFVKGSSPFNCLYCEEKFVRLSTLELHIANAHDSQDVYHCSICQYSSPCLKTVRVHVATHKGPFCCDICGAFLASKASLRNHMEGKHGSKKYACQLCTFSSTRKFGLTQHMSIHNGSILLCDQCNFTTVHKANFIKHVQRKHSKEPKKECKKDEFVCDICNAKYSTSLGLKRHQKKHTNTDDIQCPEEGCNYTTSRPDNLKHHTQKVHQGVRWPCKMCEYVASYKSDLNRHVKVTHEGFLLKCDQCKYTTPKRCRLNWHISKVHQGPGTKWLCDLCDFVAGYQGELNQHIKVVHKGFTLKCEFCEYSTPKKYRLKCHVQKVHERKVTS